MLSTVPGVEEGAEQLKQAAEEFVSAAEARGETLRGVTLEEVQPAPPEVKTEQAGDVGAEPAAAEDQAAGGSADSGEGGAGGDEVSAVKEPEGDDAPDVTDDEGAPADAGAVPVSPAGDETDNEAPEAS